MNHAKAVAGIALVFELAAQGCAAGDGGGFARLEPGTLRVGLDVSPARTLSASGLLTDLGYRVELEACTVGVERLELQELMGSTRSPARFDPANPPAGYSLCHGGHCHAEGGELVSYEEVQAGLAGGTASWEPVATAPLDRTFDLLEPQQQSLRDYAPMAELPRAVIGRAALSWNDFHCSGTVGDEASDSPSDLEIDLSLASEPITAALDVAITRDGPETFMPRVRLALDGTLFDGLDFRSLAEAGQIRIDTSAAVAAVAVERLFDAATLTVELHGKD